MADTTEDCASARLVAQFRATFADLLFDTGPGNAPLGLHWCLAPPLVPTASLGADGHPPRAIAVPVADFPRRMWVGGAVELLAPLPVGATVERATVLAAPVAKAGAGGDWRLVAAHHAISTEGRTVLTERQDIAFRRAATAPIPATAPLAPAPPATAPAPLPGHDLRRDVPTPATLLFRYSALTFNSHRIHYDAPYATGVEGHAGLLVHGPLQATVLLNLAAALLGAAPARFGYRATAPLVAGPGMIALGRRDGAGATLSVHAADGTETLRARADPA